MDNPAGMGFDQLQRIAARKDRMPGVIEKPHRFAGMAHQEPDICVGFDDCPHVMMKRHAHAKIRHAFGKLGQLPAVRWPFVGSKCRPLGDGVPDRAMPAARSIGVDDVGRAHVLQKLEMKAHSLHFRRNVLLVAAAIVPPRYDGEPKACDDRFQDARLPGELAAKFGACVA